MLHHHQQTQDDMVVSHIGTLYIVLWSSVFALAVPTVWNDLPSKQNDSHISRL